jgi:hypothetical protein
MPIVPIRDLGKYGVITDVDSYSLPAQAWSMGVNVRFRNNAVSRAPVFRNVSNLGTSNPRFVAGATPTSGLDLVFIGYENGTVTKFQNGSETAYSIAGYVPAVAEATWTKTTLAGVVYLNRPDRVPWSLGPTDTQFQALSNWDSTFRANLLRTCGGSLVALGVTKGAASSPTMVKTSSFPLAGAVPASWDITVPNTLATENILAEMSGPIIDAQTLGNSLVIYGALEAWLMTADGSTQVFNYRKLPFSKGAMNANCSLEIDGKHYVFGKQDIWTHDGYSEQSLCDGKTRDFIFNSLNSSQSSRCFISHNPRLKQLHFCYVSGDSYLKFINTPDGCNRQAVFDYGNSTWSFDDVPLVFAADQVNLSTIRTYATSVELYSTVGGSYLDQEDGFKRTLAYVGSTNVTYNLTQSLYAFDPFGAGSSVVFGVDLNATGPVTLEKTGIDLDDLGKELRGYVTLSSIYPQSRTDPDSTAPITVQMGSNDFFNTSPIYDQSQTYNGGSLYKLDYRSAGRYLALKMTYPDYHPFTLTAFDLDVDTYGER